jgi:maleylacetoacetate isomerase/maleylpyruvate isomerase
VRIALNLKGIAYEPVPVHFSRNGGEHRSRKFLALNPQGLLPALEHDGAIVTQSLAIIEYLDAQRPDPRLIPIEPLARARVQAFAQIIACDTHPLNNLRVLRYLRAELALDEEAVQRWYRHWIAASFVACEALLASQGGEFCCGNSPTLADVCLVPQVYNARRFGCELAAYPRLVGIADRLSLNDAFALAAPENQPDAE